VSPVGASTSGNERTVPNFTNLDTPLNPEKFLERSQAEGRLVLLPNREEPTNSSGNGVLARLSPSDSAF
jgi:hypothetical protein